MIDQQKPTAGLPFIPPWFDDAALTPAQFRVAAHIWRRGQCFSTAATIAKCCRINRKTVFAVLKDLEALGMIVQTSRPGQTTLISPVIPNGTGPTVVSQTEQPQIHPVSKAGRVAVAETEHPQIHPIIQAEPLPVSRTEHHPSQLEPHKGTPIKVPPRSEERATRIPPISGSASDWEVLPSTAHQLDEIVREIQSILPKWKIALQRSEQEALLQNRNSFFEIDAREWRRLKMYLVSAQAQDWKMWQPTSRSQFIENISDIRGHAIDWEDRCNRKKIPTGIDEHVQPPTAAIA